MIPEIQKKFHIYGQTDQGIMRETNDDSFLVDKESSIYAVADGLGGLPQGAVASGMAMDVLAEYLAATNLEQDFTFEEAFNRINLEVFKKGQTISEDLGIGTTLTVVRLQPDAIDIGHVGDTAVVIFQADSWKQITRDHTMAQDMIDRLRPGEQAYIPEYFSHTLTRCIGQLPTIERDEYQHPLEPGDRILIYSDGVTKTVELDEIHQRIMQASNPEAFIQELIETGNQRGGPDNITAIAIFGDQ